MATDKAGAKRRRADGYSIEEASLDGTLKAWPDEPPRPPRTPVEAARLALINSPGEVHQLAWKLSDIGRASQLASSFRRAKPSKVSPTATGTFDARAFFDTTERKWRIAARYLPADQTAGQTGK